MERLFLEVPSIKRKQDVKEYLEENVKYNSDLNGVGCIQNCLDGMTYEECLLELERRENLDYVNQNNLVPSKTFFVVRENDNRIVGMINVRYKIKKEKLNTWASHIGYGIRPTERRKGYAKIALYLGILEEQKMGEDKILLVCTTDNIGSNKTILSLGGKLEKTEFDQYDEEMTNYYLLDIVDSIKRYYEYYEPCIKRDFENNVFH